MPDDPLKPKLVKKPPYDPDAPGADELAKFHALGAMMKSIEDGAFQGDHPRKPRAFRPLRSHTTLTGRFPAEMMAQLDILADARMLPLEGLIVELIREYLDSMHNRPSILIKYPRKLPGAQRCMIEMLQARLQRILHEYE